MPLMPKRVKFRKVSKGNRSGYATSGTELAYGEFGIAHFPFSAFLTEVPH